MVFAVGNLVTIGGPLAKGKPEGTVIEQTPYGVHFRITPTHHMFFSWNYLIDCLKYNAIVVS